MARTLEDKLAIAGEYVLLNGASGQKDQTIVAPFKLDYVTISLFLVDRDKLGNQAWMVRFDGLRWTAFVGPGVFPPTLESGASLPKTEDVRFEVDRFDPEIEVRKEAEQWLDRHLHSISAKYGDYVKNYALRRLLGFFGISMKPHQLG